ncbi:unnamed protein product [Miscanthus lutarioriparius]|uniref:SANTA domain-containing protein n=1 Tax=Miscanthus lutarioriparius TaxID=422564 RepID=A0A811S4I8_9POAL|nr:unnamed protein product [Miscanthus lutarioriparius]
MKPLPPAGSPHRRDTPPSLLSPFSRSAFPAAADGDHDAAVSEQPSVMLLEWWLATVEGDEQKIAVAGTFRWKQILHELYPAPIAKRHSVNILESEDGTVLLISGSLNVSRSLDNGYSNAVCKHFFVGFPHWWQSCNLRYPKRTNSDTGCQPSSSNTSKHPDGLKSSSRNESVFRKSSHLSNGTPRFEEHTCDGDIATNENAAASSEAGKDRKKTPVACLKNQGSWGENQHVPSNKKMKLTDLCLGKQPVGQPKKQISPHKKCQSATKSPGTRSPDSYGANQELMEGRREGLNEHLLDAMGLQAKKTITNLSGREFV